jgi:hypothetical protein
MGKFDREWLAATLGAACMLATACQGDELLQRNAAAGLNGSFEITEAGYPVNWAFFPNPEADSTLSVVLDSSQVVEGSHSLKIIVRPSERLPALRSTQVRVQPETSYRFSMSFRNEGCGLKVNRIVLDASGKTVRRRDLIIDTSVSSTEWEAFEETLSVAQKRSPGAAGDHDRRIRHGVVGRREIGGDGGMIVSSSREIPLIGLLAALLLGLGCRADSRAVARVEIRDSAWS